MKDLRRTKIERKKLLQIIIISVSVISLLVGLIMWRHYHIVKDEQYAKDITNLTQIYKKNQSEKSAIVTDEDGNKSYSDEFTRGDLEIGNGASTSITDEGDKEGEVFLNKVLVAINDDKYEDIYELFNKKYIDDFGYSLDKFKAKYSFDGGATGEVTNIYEEYNSKIYTIKFIERNTGYLVIEDFTVFDDGTIADKYIKQIKDMNNKVTIDDVTYTIKNKYVTKNDCYYNIIVDNKSKNLIEISDMLIKNNDTICIYEITSANKQLKCYPGIPFKYQFKLSNVDDITNIEIRYPNLQGETIKTVIYKKE